MVNKQSGSEFDCGIICVNYEYSPLHLSPVSDRLIIGVSKSINIHCILQVTRMLNESSLLQGYDTKINRFCCDLIAINRSKGC